MSFRDFDIAKDFLRTMRVPVGQGTFPRTDVSSTTAESDIWSYTIPGGELGVERIFRVEFGGLITNNTGSSTTVRFRIYLGSTKLWDDITPSLATSANGRGLYMRLLLANEGSESSQDLSGLIVIGGTGAVTTGRGDIGSDEIAGHAAIDGASSEDSTGDLVFRVACVPTLSNANLIVSRYRCTAEVI